MTKCQYCDGKGYLNKCTHCNGSGEEPAVYMTKCQYCDGQEGTIPCKACNGKGGIYYTHQGDMGDTDHWVTCESCHGKGYLNKCTHCYEGRIPN